MDQILVHVRVGKELYKRRGGMQYFKSEKKLQAFMRNKGVIGNVRYFINVIERLIIQVLMPNFVRSIVFKKIAREK